MKSRLVHCIENTGYCQYAPGRYQMTSRPQPVGGNATAALCAQARRALAFGRARLPLPFRRLVKALCRAGEGIAALVTFATFFARGGALLKTYNHCASISALRVFSVK